MPRPRHRSSVCVPRHRLSHYPLDDFFDARFFVAVFFADDFFAVFFDDDFVAAAFFALFFFGATLAPDRRASLSPIAMACFGFLTLGPFFDPECSSPRLYSRITFATFFCAFFVVFRAGVCLLLLLPA